MTAQLVMSNQQVAAEPERWLKERRGGVTASEIAAVIGLANPEYESAWSVFASKTTGQEFGGDTDATERGKHLEPYVADRYIREHPGSKVIDGGLYRVLERPWQMATLDRLVRYGTDSRWLPMQIKTSATFEGWGEPGTHVIPPEYRPQGLWEMDVWDADEIIVPCLFMGPWKVRVYRIVRDAAADRFIRYMREAAQEFLQRIADDDPPPIDWTPATTRALRAIYKDEPEGETEISAALAKRYRQARRAVRKAERQMGQVTNEILAEAGDAKVIRFKDHAGSPNRGKKIATRLKYKRHGVNADMLREQFPDIAKMVETETEVQTLYPGSWAQDK